MFVSWPSSVCGLASESNLETFSVLFDQMSFLFLTLSLLFWYSHYVHHICCCPMFLEYSVSVFQSFFTHYSGVHRRCPSSLWQRLWLISGIYFFDFLGKVYSFYCWWYSIFLKLQIEVKIQRWLRSLSAKDDQVLRGDWAKGSNLGIAGVMHCGKLEMRG